MRTLSVDMQAALLSDSIRPVIFLQLELHSTTLYFNTSRYDIALSGHTYLSSGFLLSLDSIEEDTSKSSLWKVTLTGESQALVSYALQDLRIGLSGVLSFGLCDTAIGVIADPIVVYVGSLSSAQIQDEPDGSALVLTYGQRKTENDRINEYRLNNATQRAFYADDAGFEYVEQVNKWSGFWGKVEKKK